MMMTMSSIESDNNKVVFTGVPNPSHKHLTNLAFNQDDLSQEFFDYGKVEVLPDRDFPNLWYEAYIFDIENVPISDDAGDILNSQHCIASVVMAIDNEDAAVTLSLMKNVKKYSIDQIRFIPKINPEMTIHDNEMVEVRVNDLNSFVCWKLAKVKMVKGDCIALEFASNAHSRLNSNDSSNLEVASTNETRLLNINKPLSHEYNPFFHFHLEISSDLLLLLEDDFAWVSKYELHKDFKKYLNLLNVSFNCETKSMVCLGFALTNKVYDEEKVTKRIKMLSSMHFNKLNDYYWLNVSKSRQDKTFSLNSENSANNQECLIKVMVGEHLIGLSIGKNGHQIQKARLSDGIKSIELDENTKTFTIRGVSMEACLKAASFVNFIEEFNNYSSDYQDFFNDKHSIQELVDKSGIHLMNLANNDDTIRVQLIGTLETVENFKILLNFQLSEWHEIQSLKMKNQKLNQQIHSSLDTTNQYRSDDRRDDYPKRYNTSKYLTGDSRYNREPKNFAEVVKGGNFF